MADQLEALTRGVSLRYPRGDMIALGNQQLMIRSYLLQTSPGSITEQDLQTTSLGIQHQAAVFWFLLNYRPFIPATQSPAPAEAIASRSALASEFQANTESNTLSDSVLDDIAEELPGLWQPLGGAPAAYINAMVSSIGPNRPTPEELRTAILSGLKETRKALRPRQKQQQQQPQPPSDPVGMGHNMGPDLGPLTEEQRDEIEKLLEIAENGVREGSASGLDKSESALDTINNSYLVEVGRWISEQFMKGMLREAGRLFIDYVVLHHMITLYYWPHISQQLIHFLHHGVLL